MQLYTINATPLRDKKDTDKNNSLMACYPSIVTKTLSRYDIEGFTMYEVLGYWQGIGERSYKIEIATDDAISIRMICQDLRDKYNQDAVMLTNPDNTVEFI